MATLTDGLISYPNPNPNPNLQMGETALAKELAVMNPNPVLFNEREGKTSDEHGTFLDCSQEIEAQLRRYEERYQVVSLFYLLFLFSLPFLFSFLFSLFSLLSSLFSLLPLFSLFCLRSRINFMPFSFVK